MSLVYIKFFDRSDFRDMSLLKPFSVNAFNDVTMYAYVWLVDGRRADTAHFHIVANWKQNKNIFNTKYVFFWLIWKYTAFFSRKKLLKLLRKILICWIKLNNNGICSEFVFNISHIRTRAHIQKWWMCSVGAFAKQIILHTHYNVCE